MRRTLGGTTALLVGVLVVLLGPGAGAQTLPTYAGVTVTPTQVSGVNDVITVRGPAFPGGVGCRPGTVLAVPGTGLANAVPLDVGADLNTPDPALADDKWTVTTKAGAVPLAAGSYTIYLECNEGQQQIYLTTAVLTVAATATTVTTVSTTTTTSTTAPGSTNTPTGTQGAVEPSTVKPGIDTLTIRGSGFKPAAQLQITLGTTPVTAVGTTNAAANGAYAATLKLPASAPPGNQQLVVTGPGPDDVSRSTTASLTVQDLNCSDFASPAAAQAGLGAGGADPHGLDADKDGTACEAVRARSAAGGGSATAATGSLPATGTEHTSYGLVAGLAAMTLGALLVGLSHPVVPATGPRRHRRGNHFR